MAYTTIDNPELYFQVKTYTGNGSTQTITFDNTDADLDADMIWLKSRSDAYSHQLFDTVRGANELLNPEATDAEQTLSGITAFATDSFSIGSDAGTNANTKTYVAWCWKETATAGFDIVSYTGNGSNRTISHSLSAKPAMMIVKQRSASRDWWVYNKNLDGTDGATGVLYLSTTDAAGTSATTSWNSTAPTTSVFSLGTTVGVNKASQTYIAYLFAEKQGFSKFGSYIGNGNANGTFVYTGFRPAFVMLKNTTDARNWIIVDNKRLGYNTITSALYPDNNDAEASASGDPVMDFTAQGFKLRDTSDHWNESGDTFIYMAIAESSFVNSSGVPNNAR